MELGKNIKNLRLKKGLTQEQFAFDLNISVQTVSRWETETNSPDISVLPVLAAYFNVTTDFLLGIKGVNKMAKLIKTVETFEFRTRKEAEEMLEKFKKEKFPVLKEYKIYDSNPVRLEVVKEFNSNVENMKF